MTTSISSSRTPTEDSHPKVAAKWNSHRPRQNGAAWESFLALWQRAEILRSFIWNQEYSDEKILLRQLLIRLRRFFHAEFCFAALYEENAKTVQVSDPETAADRLPANFVRHTLDLLKNSRSPLAWNELGKESSFRNVVVAPIPGAVGNPIGFIVVAQLHQDDRVQGEIVLLQALASELGWALRRLRMQSQQHKLLAGVSHELKNSLNVIMGDCALLRDVLEAQPELDSCHELTSIDKMSQEILDLIRNALDANLLAEGKSVVFEGAVGLVDLLEEALFPCREKAKAADIALVINYAQDLPEEVSTDVMRLKQVIRNLVNQAVEFPEREIVQVTVKRKDEVLEVNVAGLRLDGEQEPRHDWDLGAGALESIREQLESLAGHMHLVSRPGLGYEVTLCLPCL